jgi:hypothetical protein
VVILPFANETSEPELDKLVRDSFYGHFSPKNYRDFELNEVDGFLSSIQETTSGEWRKLPPSSLGGLFHADFLIYGRVTDFSKTFLGVYSQIALKMELEMVSTGGGETVFRKRMVKRSHEGGLPFSLFGIGSAAVRSGLHMKKERTLDLIDRLNRELVALIPDPPAPPTSPVLFDIQVASFMEEKRALATSDTFIARGFRSRVEGVILQNQTWYRVLLGPFYNLSEAEQARDRVREQSHFQPILIQHRPGARTQGVRGLGGQDR